MHSQLVPCSFDLRIHKIRLQHGNTLSPTPFICTHSLVIYIMLLCRTKTFLSWTSHILMFQCTNYVFYFLFSMTFLVYSNLEIIYLVSLSFEYWSITRFWLYSLLLLNELIVLVVASYHRVLCCSHSSGGSTIMELMDGVSL